MRKRIIILSIVLLILVSITVLADDITVNENVKLGGIVVEAQNYKLYYTGHKAGEYDNLYFEVVTKDMQYQMIVPMLMRKSEFELEIGVKLKITNVDKYLNIKVERID